MFALADINSFYASCESPWHQNGAALVSGETNAPGEENTCIFQQLCAVPQHEPTGYGCSGVAFSRS